MRGMDNYGYQAVALTERLADPVSERQAGIAPTTPKRCLLSGALPQAALEMATDCSFSTLIACRHEILRKLAIELYQLHMEGAAVAE